MKGLANRRSYEQRSKSKAKEILKTRLNREPNAEEIGKTASVHGRDCSCWMCGNPRTHFGQKTLQEQALESIESVLRDVI